MTLLEEVQKGPIKSIQRGDTSVSATTLAVTISAVDPARTVCNMLTVGGSTVFYRMVLTDATTITFYRTAGTNANVSWEVIEYN